MFVVNQMPGDCFTLKNMSTFVSDTMEKQIELQSKYKEQNNTKWDSMMEHSTWDIEGMYPNMPKEKILLALNSILDEMSTVTKKVTARVTIPVRQTTVVVPKSRSEKPRFGVAYEKAEKGSTTLTFQVMNERRPEFLSK